MSETNYVYDENIEKLENEVARLNRRAAKLNVPAIQLHIGEIEKVLAGNPEQEHLRAHVTLVGTPPQLGGYTFEAVVDHLSNGLITSYPGSTLDLSPFRGVDATCDHCQVNRKRHETFIVRHEDATTKRVGRTCLGDFLGHHGNPSALIGHLNLWGKAFEALEGAEAAGTGTSKHTLALASFVAHVSQDIRAHGWLSRGKAFESGGVATADRAQNAYWSQLDRNITAPSAEDVVKADGAIAWARALTDEQVEDNDYLFNLRAVCQDDFIRPKRGGLAGSVLVAAGRAFEKAQRATQVHLSNEYVGSLKERLTLDLKLANLRRTEGFYGTSYMHSFEDAAGNCLIWFASNPTVIRDGKGKRDMVVGETLRLAGTVKKQDEFRERKQTILSRVSHPKGK
jgi:hypothetical protein